VTPLEQWQAREVALDVLLEKHSPVKPYAYEWSVACACKPIYAHGGFFEGSSVELIASLQVVDNTKPWGALYVSQWLPPLGESFERIAAGLFRSIEARMRGELPWTVTTPHVPNCRCVAEWSDDET
jgi:hypothetical protein